jgi:hypothetical protein
MIDWINTAQGVAAMVAAIFAMVGIYDKEWAQTTSDST